MHKANLPWETARQTILPLDWTLPASKGPSRGGACVTQLSHNSNCQSCPQAPETCHEPYHGLDHNPVGRSLDHGLKILPSAIAHELNQPLAAVSNYIETLLALLRSGTALDACMLCDIMETCRQDITRASEVIRFLGQITKLGDANKVKVSLETLVTEALELLTSGGTPAPPAVTLRLDPDAAWIFADAIQLRHTLFSLLRNAMLAAPEGGPNGSDVTVDIISRPRRDMIEIICEPLYHARDTLAGRQLSLPSEEKMADMLDIGMSICRIIVECHGGHMWTTASMEGGIAFHFTIPQVPKLGGMTNGQESRLCRG